jgi:hypothetical protein
MRKPIIAALAALAVAGGTVAAAVPASAEGWHGHGGYGWRGGGWRGGDAGPAIFAGVAGLALGAALASPRYDYGPPPPAYYPGYDYRPYGTCYSRERVWDPYYGHYVIRSFPYAC